MVVGCHPPEFAIGGDDLDGPDVVGGEPVAAAQRAEAPAEGVGDGSD
jgi:hypothetical protein